MAANVQLHGMAQTIANMRELRELMSAKSRASPLLPALRAAGKVVQRDAKMRVRKKSLALHDNIIVARVRQGRINGATEAVEVTVRYKARKYADNRANRRTGRFGGEYRDYGPLFYGRILEFGSSKNRAYPFLRPAFDSNASALPGVVQAELAKSISAAVSKMRVR